jgi:hypothetical protein
MPDSKNSSRRGRGREEARALMLDAAREMFAAKGFAATIREIADRAMVTEQLLLTAAVGLTRLFRAGPVNSVLVGVVGAFPRLDHQALSDAIRPRPCGPSALKTGQSGGWVRAYRCTWNPKMFLAFSRKVVGAARLPVDFRCRCHSRFSSMQWARLCLAQNVLVQSRAKVVRISMSLNCIPGRSLSVARQTRTGRPALMLANDNAGGLFWGCTLPRHCGQREECGSRSSIVRHQGSRRSLRVAVTRDSRGHWSSADGIRDAYFGDPGAMNRGRAADGKWVDLPLACSCGYVGMVS